MKLIDKIQQATSGKPDDYSRIYNPTAEVIEKIADEFAIEFADWMNKSGYLIELIKGSRKTNKILEIFKKEKGL
jgi:uncharacterized protein YjgD (DUF1641 family)